MEFDTAEAANSLIGAGQLLIGNRLVRCRQFYPFKSITQRAAIVADRFDLWLYDLEPNINETILKRAYQGTKFSSVDISVWKPEDPRSSGLN